MPNENGLSQNDVSRFLLGLGIGLVVGFIFKPPSNDFSRRFRESATTTTRRSGSQAAPATSKR